MSKWRHLPNIISMLRLGAVPVLVWLAYSGAEKPFAWLLVAAGVTDFLDGWLARRFGWASNIGAVLDSIADIAVVLVVLFAVWILHPYVFTEHGWIICAIMGVWASSNLIGLFRYGRTPSFHTAFARFGLFMFGVFALVLFFYQFLPWLLYLSGGIAFLAGVESLLMVLLVDKWQPDLRGGLPAVLKQRRKNA